MKWNREYINKELQDIRQRRQKNGESGDYSTNEPKVNIQMEKVETESLLSTGGKKIGSTTPHPLKTY